MGFPNQPANMSNSLTQALFDGKYKVKVDDLDAFSDEIKAKMQELKDAVDHNMPYDHIKFLVDDLAVLIRELQNAG